MGEEEEDGGFHITRRLCWWTPPVRPAAGSLGVICPEKKRYSKTQWMDPHSPPISVPAVN